MSAVVPGFALHWKEKKHLCPQIHFDGSGLGHMFTLKPIAEVRGMEYMDWDWLNLVHMLYTWSWW